jgi:ABC-type uncharacterized transport system permease subunit
MLRGIEFLTSIKLCLFSVVLFFKQSSTIHCWLLAQLTLLTGESLVKGFFSNVLINLVCTGILLMLQETKIQEF